MYGGRAARHDAGPGLGMRHRRAPRSDRVRSRIVDCARAVRGRLATTIRAVTRDAPRRDHPALRSRLGVSASGDSLLPGGLLDETAHLLTMLLILWALGPRFWSRRVLVPALVASVAIDADHVPGYLGAGWLTVGTPRPYTHSLLTVAVILAGALLWRRQRVVLLAVAFGIVVHFWRDLSESSAGVSLLWPASDHAFTLPHSSYLVAMAAIVALDALRCRSQRGDRRAAASKCGASRRCATSSIDPIARRRASVT